MTCELPHHYCIFIVIVSHLFQDVPSAFINQSEKATSTVNSSMCNGSSQRMDFESNYQDDLHNRLLNFITFS